MCWSDFLFPPPGPPWPFFSISQSFYFSVSLFLSVSLLLPFCHWPVRDELEHSLITMSHNWLQGRRSTITWSCLYVKRMEYLLNFLLPHLWENWIASMNFLVAEVELRNCLMAFLINTYMASWSSLFWWTTAKWSIWLISGRCSLKLVYFMGSRPAKKNDKLHHYSALSLSIQVWGQVTGDDLINSTSYWNYSWMAGGRDQVLHPSVWLLRLETETLRPGRNDQKAKKKKKKKKKSRSRKRK